MLHHGCLDSVPHLQLGDFRRVLYFLRPSILVQREAVAALHIIGQFFWRTRELDSLQFVAIVTAFCFEYILRRLFQPSLLELDAISGGDPLGPSCVRPPRKRKRFSWFCVSVF